MEHPLGSDYYQELREDLCEDARDDRYSPLREEADPDEDTDKPELAAPFFLTITPLEVMMLAQAGGVRC